MRVGERADEGRASAPRSTRGRPTRCGEPTNSSSPPRAPRDAVVVSVAVVGPVAVGRGARRARTVATSSSARDATGAYDRVEGVSGRRGIVAGAARASGRRAAGGETNASATASGENRTGFGFEPMVVALTPSACSPSPTPKGCARARERRRRRESLHSANRRRRDSKETRADVPVVVPGDVPAGARPSRGGANEMALSRASAATAAARDAIARGDPRWTPAEIGDRGGEDADGREGAVILAGTRGRRVPARIIPGRVPGPTFVPVPGPTPSPVPGPAPASACACARSNATAASCNTRNACANVVPDVPETIPRDVSGGSRSCDGSSSEDDLISGASFPTPFAAASFPTPFAAASFAPFDSAPLIGTSPCRSRSRVAPFPILTRAMNASASYSARSRLNPASEPYELAGKFNSAPHPRSLMATRSCADAASRAVRNDPM